MKHLQLFTSAFEQASLAGPWAGFANLRIQGQTRHPGGDGFPGIGQAPYR